MTEGHDTRAVLSLLTATRNDASRSGKEIEHLRATRIGERNRTPQNILMTIAWRPLDRMTLFPKQDSKIYWWPSSDVLWTEWPLLPNKIYKCFRREHCFPVLKHICFPVLKHILERLGHKATTRRFRVVFCHFHVKYMFKNKQMIVCVCLLLDRGKFCR